HKCISNKVNFISGTVSPAQSGKPRKYTGKYSSKNKTKIDTTNKPPADTKIDDIESLSVGINYILETYGSEVTLSIQPKFMGSRLNVYLFRDDHLKKSYCVTRNGYLCY